MKNQTCCFTGHRKIQKSEIKEIQKSLEKELIKLISQGVKYFGAGGALGFDTLAAQTVLKLKKKFPQIKLIMVLPCKGQEKYWSEKEKTEYASILKKADKIVYTSEHYHQSCMHVRNRHLVDNSNYCIAYLNQTKGGTAYTVNYAKQKGLQITNTAKNCYLSHGIKLRTAENTITTPQGITNKAIYIIN
jgi:Uncharacterized protein conserved in bacteria